MALVSSTRPRSERPRCAVGAARPSSRRARLRYSVTLGSLAVAGLACAQVLGIPTDPELVPAPLAPGLPAHDPPAPSPGGADAGPHEGATPIDPDDSDGVVPPGDVAGLGGRGPVADGSSSATSDTEPKPQPAPAEVPDGGAGTRDAGGVADAGAGGGEPEPPEPACPAELQRALVDVVMIADNSGTMIATAAELEQALPAFAARLDQLQVDYRLILLSGHRAAARGTTALNDASLCIAAPLGGLDACPSAAPAPGPRFFPYAIPIGATSSFAQVLAALRAPDPFELTRRGWAEWLRDGARKVVIELSDADSDLPLADFVRGLADASPEHFTDDATSPGFVFHAVVGLPQKGLELDLYGPEEPIESEACAGTGSDPANAGEIYQQLSRSTRGLRQSICPASAMNVRLQVLAADIIARSVVVCP